ncbi:hypothetical protein K439DRAFT_1617625 [Ramaria rubella]|nr:hypothetical protein K439DRAFT_1617625 [Ramaria rubella]
MAASIFMVIRAAPVLMFDRLQRERTKRRESAWVKHLAKHVDTVLSKLLGPFSSEYVAGMHHNTADHPGESLRITPGMLYDLAELLGLVEHETDPPHEYTIDLPVPLLPHVVHCPEFQGAMI